MDKYEDRTEIVLENFGEKIFGIFHLPIGIKKPPCVMFCHGLAGHKIGEHRVYVYLAELLSKVGIASLRVDFRGSGDSEGEFSEMTLEGEVSDALVALNFLRESPLVDPERIGIYGRSFGAAVDIIAAKRMGNIRSMALWAPIFDGHQWELAWEMQESG
ncbi:MAG: alpha/beta hydrolase, partial [Waddliaceae bacterium]